MPQNPPADWPKLSVALVYDDALAAIDFLEKAFGFTTRVKIEAPDGSLAHSELVCGDAVVMVASPAASRPRLALRSPASAGGVTSGMYMYVDDIDAHCERARAAGAEIIAEPTTKHYGDRNYEVRDPEGHWWSFGERLDDEAWKKATEAEHQA